MAPSRTLVHDIRHTCSFYSIDVAPSTLLYIYIAISVFIGCNFIFSWFPHLASLYYHRPSFLKFLRRYRVARWYACPVSQVLCVAMWGTQPLFFIAGFKCKDKRFNLALWQGWTVWAAQGLLIGGCIYARWQLVQRGAATRGDGRASAAGRDVEQGASGSDTMLVVPRPGEETPAAYERLQQPPGALAPLAA